MFSDSDLEYMISLISGERTEVIWRGPAELVEDEEGNPAGVTPSDPQSATMAGMSASLSPELWEQIARYLIRKRLEQSAGGAPLSD